MSEATSNQEGQILGRVVKALENLEMRMERLENASVKQATDIASRNGLSWTHLAVIMSIVIPSITAALTYSTMASENNALNREVMTMKENHVAEIAAAERITSMETLMRVALNSSAGVPRQQ